MITIYTKVNCPYCKNAKILLDRLKLHYKELSLEPNDSHYNSKRDRLFNLYKHRSFPIIIIGQHVLGGYSELVESYNSLKLHRMCSEVGLYVQFDV